MDGEAGGANTPQRLEAKMSTGKEESAGVSAEESVIGKSGAEDKKDAGVYAVNDIMTPGDVDTNDKELKESNEDADANNEELNKRNEEHTDSWGITSPAVSIDMDIEYGMA